MLAEFITKRINYIYFFRVITCAKLELSDYFNAHEAVLKMVLANHDYYSLPRRHLRYSAIDEAFESLGTILAVNNLARYKFINKPFSNDYTDETYDTRMTALLLVALRTLPKLPFYLAADRWRLNELKFGSNDVPKSWWTTR